MRRTRLVAIEGARQPAERPVQACLPMERALLPWEDPIELLAQRAALHEEHKPQGDTESGLVDQLVWIAWRRRRLIIGERAAHMAALHERLSPLHNSIETAARALGRPILPSQPDELANSMSTTPAEDQQELAANAKDLAMTRRAIAILETGDPAGYEEALATLDKDTRDWWQEVAAAEDGDSNPHAKARGGDCDHLSSRSRERLLRFLVEEVKPHYAETRSQIARRPAIRLQLEGESLDPFRMDRILALDERLTRQFEKTLGMLLKLQEMRRSVD